MKTLGTTTEGNYLVEMSPDEHWAFYKVEEAVNGRGISILQSPRGISLGGTNLAPIFTALHDLFDAKVSINVLREYVDSLDAILGNSK